MKSPKLDYEDAARIAERYKRIKAKARAQQRAHRAEIDAYLLRQIYALQATKRPTKQNAALPPNITSKEKSAVRALRAQGVAWKKIPDEMKAKGFRERTPGAYRDWFYPRHKRV